MKLKKLLPFDLWPKLLLASVMTPLLLGSFELAISAPLDQNQVAADAKWLAHVDFDALKSATLAEKIQNRWLDSKMVQKRLTAVKVTTGVNLITDLHGVTFYGTRPLLPNSGVVFLHAKFDAKRLVNLAKRKPGYQSSEYNGHGLHTWTKRKANPREHTIPEYSVTGSVFKPGILILGGNVSDVKAALDVLDGKTASLMSSDATLVGDVPQGAIVLASVLNLSDLAVPFKSPIVKQSESFWTVLGEQDGNLFGKGKFVTKSDEAAIQVKDIIQGIRAMALLQHASDPSARKLIERLKATISGQTVHIEWSGEAEGVWKLIERHDQKLKK